MKFCEKCGNKLKDGFEFCDKCGAKVNKKEEKKKEEKEEKKIEKEEKKEVKEVVKPVPVMYQMPKKSGKGKIVFLTILNLLLLAATITFLVLWLVKPEGSCTNSNSSSGTGTGTNTEKDPPAKVPSYVGQWEQNVEYKSGSKVTQRTYGMIELMSNDTFSMIYYDKDDISNTKEQLKGTYEVDGDDITFNYTYEGKTRTKTAYFEDDKMCLNSNCTDYLVKDSYNNTIVIQSTKSEIEYINYTQYENLQKDYEDAIVVVVREGCSWCEKYESVVEEIMEEYTTPVYYYENDGKISISGTPTTIIIKNGYVVGSIEGYKDFSTVSSKLDDLGVK